MQVFQRSAILLFVLWLAPCGALAAEPLRNEELIEKSGIAGQVRAYTDEFEKLGRQPVWVHKQFEKMVETLWADMADAFSAEKIFSIIDRGLQEHLTEEDKSLLLAHYNSQLGRRITELEVKASQPGAEAGIDAVAQELVADPAKYADRRALYMEIDEAIGPTTLILPFNMAYPMLATPVLLWMAMKDLDAAATLALLEQHRSEQEKQEAGTMALMAYTYRDLEIQDLHAYLAFLNSTAAKKFNLTLERVLMETLFAGPEEFQKRHQQHLSPRR